MLVNRFFLLAELHCDFVLQFFAGGAAEQTDVAFLLGFKLDVALQERMLGMIRHLFFYFFVCLLMQYPQNRPMFISIQFTGPDSTALRRVNP